MGEGKKRQKEEQKNVVAARRDKKEGIFFQNSRFFDLFALTHNTCTYL